MKNKKDGLNEGGSARRGRKVRLSDAVREAAPELLAALKELDRLCDFTDDDSPSISWCFDNTKLINAAMKRALAAIAKAEGAVSKRTTYPNPETAAIQPQRSKS